MSIQDLMHNTLKVNYSGTLNEMQKAFYNDNASASIGCALNAAKLIWLRDSKGFTVGTLQDRDVAYLRSKGYVGPYSDMLYAALVNSDYYSL